MCNLLSYTHSITCMQTNQTSPPPPHTHTQLLLLYSNNSHMYCGVSASKWKEAKSRWQVNKDCQLSTRKQCRRDRDEDQQGQS